MNNPMIAEFSFKTVNLENCIIDRRNFSGNEVKRNGRTLNEEGRRNFLLILDPEMTEEFKDRGWAVGKFAQREEGVEPEGFLRINVSYFKQPPIIHYISNGVDTLLDESRLHILDKVNMENIDMRIVAVNKQNRDGVWQKRAFVDEMWITVTPDRFMEKYKNLRRSNDEAVMANSPAEDDELPFDN